MQIHAIYEDGNSWRHPLSNEQAAPMEHWRMTMSPIIDVGLSYSLSKPETKLLSKQPIHSSGNNWRPICALQHIPVPYGIYTYYR